jgi:hypothetical protein
LHPALRNLRLEVYYTVLIDYVISKQVFFRQCYNRVDESCDVVMVHFYLLDQDESHQLDIHFVVVLAQTEQQLGYSRYLLFAVEELR